MYVIIKAKKGDKPDFTDLQIAVNKGEYADEIMVIAIIMESNKTKINHKAEEACLPYINFEAVLGTQGLFWSQSFFFNVVIVVQLVKFLMLVFIDFQK